MDSDSDIARLAQFGDMDVVRRIGAAHIEGVLGPLGSNHPEIGQEFLLFVEIGRAQPPVGEIEGFDYRHDNLPMKTLSANPKAFWRSGRLLRSLLPRSH